MHHASYPQPLEDDIAAEESMELASPLMPTVSTAVPSHDTHTEIDLVTFPFSPKHASSPRPASTTPLTSPGATRRSPGSQDIGRVQAALGVAQNHLKQKEEALAQLHAEVERLQLEVQAQTRSNGDEDGG